MPNIVEGEESPTTDGQTGLLRRTGDMPLRVGAAVNTTIKLLSDFFGADNAVSRSLNENSKWYEDLLSVQAQQNDKEVERILKEAQDKGLLDQLGAGLKAFSVAPADFIAGGAGSLLPFLAAGAAAKAAGLGYLGITATQSALAGCIQVGAVKASIYEEVQREMISQGRSEEAAKAVAQEAQRYGGKNTDQLMIAAGLGVAGARVGAHRAITRGLIRGGFKGAGDEVAMVLKEGLWEGGVEALQGGHEAISGNFALKREGVDIGLTRGVFSQGVLEGTVGLFAGSGMAGAGAISAGLDSGRARNVDQDKTLEVRPLEEKVDESAPPPEDIAGADPQAKKETSGVFAIENVEELVKNGGGRVAVLRDGKEVPFKNFALDITNNEATVMNIELGIGESQGTGVGFGSYVALGNQLAQRGVVLRSSSSQLVQGRKLWEGLVREGRAKAFGNGYSFLPEVDVVKEERVSPPADPIKAATVNPEAKQADNKSRTPQLSPGKKRALGLVDNPAGSYLVATQPHLFQGVGNPVQYQTRLDKAIVDLEQKIDNGDFLNTGFDRDAFVREHHFNPGAEHSARHLKSIRDSQAEVHREWKEYLRDGGYSQENRLLILSSVVKEKAEQVNGGWDVHSLGGNSNRRTPDADTDAASKFAERFAGDQKPSQVLSECFAEAAAERVARRRDQATQVQVTEWGGSIAWQKFNRIPKDVETDPDSKGSTARVKELSETAKTVAQFGMTTWCTNETRMARHQLQGGDFWVGVDEQGRARLAVRLGGEKQIEEVSGVLPRQAIEPKYANVVNDLVQKEGFVGGEKFVEDALLKGKVAEMKDPGNWEEFKAIVGKSTDGEAIDFYRKYRGPRGGEDFLVGADNAPLNKTLWEKTKDDGGSTPLVQAALSGQMGAAMKWIDFSMLDTVYSAESQPKFNGNGGSHAHTMFRDAGDGAGIEFFGSLMRAGYLTPDRQMSVDGRGNSLSHLIVSDPSRAPSVAEWKGLHGDSLRIPNLDGVTGFMAMANNSADGAAKTVTGLAKNGILGIEDQRQADHSGKNLLHHLGRTPNHFWADYNNPESALSSVIEQPWVDHSALFTPDKDGKSALAYMPFNGESGRRALLFLRDNGHLTDQRQQSVDAEGKNIFHKLGEEGRLGDFLSWEGTNLEALRARDGSGKSPFDYYFGQLRGADGWANIEPRLEAARSHLDNNLLFDSPMVEGSTERPQSQRPLIFTVVENGGVGFLLRNGIVDNAAISASRSGEDGISPWHVAKLGSDLPDLVQNGLVQPRDFLVADQNGVTAAMVAWAARRLPRRWWRGLITKEVLRAKDNEGRSLVHHAVKGGGLVRMMTGGLVDREEMGRLDGMGRNMLHHFDGKPWGLGGEEVAFRKAVSEGIVRSEDFMVRDANGELPLSAFIKSPSWVEALGEAGLLSREMLAEISPSTGKRVIDSIPGKSSSTIRLLAENGLIDRDLLLDKRDKISVLAKFIESESEDGGALEGVRFLSKHCGLKPEDLGATELHSTLFDERDGKTSFQSLIKGGFVTEKAILSRSQETIPLLSRIMAMKNGAETFNLLVDNGVISDKALLVESGARDSAPIGELLLSNAIESPEWQQVAQKAVAKGLISRELILADKGKNKDAVGRDSSGVVGDALFKDGNEGLLKTVLDQNLINGRDLSSPSGNSMTKTAIANGGESLSILLGRGLLDRQTVSSISIDDWGSSKTPAHYLLEHKPRAFAEMNKRGIFVAEDFVARDGKLSEAMSHAIEKGKLELLEDIDFSKTRLSQDQLAQGWNESKWGKNVGAFCSFLSSTGMTKKEISMSLVTPNASGVNSLGGLASGGVGLVLPLVEAGVIGRRELTGEWIPGLKGSDRDALNAVLSSHPEQWKTLIDRQVLHSGDLYRNQSSYYPTPFRTMLGRCRSPQEESALAKHVSESGILHEEDRARLALDTTQRASSGREALKAFISSGDIQGRHLAEKRDDRTALDNLIDLSKKEGPDTLNFVLTKGLIDGADAPRVKRAIAGEHSPLMDTMEAVSHKVRQLLNPERGGSKNEATTLSRGGRTEFSEFEERRRRQVISN